MKALVTGAGGFIGGHLVSFLKEKGYWVRGVDIKEHEFKKTDADDFQLMDLRLIENCKKACEGMDEVYALAADMGGIGYITFNNVSCLKNNVLLNTHTIDAAYEAGVKKYFYSSSACIYPTYKQMETTHTGLKESEAYPADPDNEYGWEKIFSERVAKAYQQECGMFVRIARFHNIYGPNGTYDGGKEKSPAAIARKVAQASDGGEIEIWGDGEQGRSYLFIEDCLEGIWRLMNSDCLDPINLGSDRLVSINELADMAMKISGKSLTKKYDLDAPQGVRGRNADLSYVREHLDWEPKISLEEGLEKTYKWIEEQLGVRS